MEFSQKVIILKVGVFREADCWVKFCSPTHGILTAFAFGAKKSKRRFVGCLNPLSEVLFHIVKSNKGDYWQLNEGIQVNNFSNIKKDIAKLGMMMNCLRFFEVAYEESHSFGEPYYFLHSMLACADISSRVNNFIPFIFRAKTAFNQGYQPNFINCLQCGKNLRTAGEVFFSVQSGGGYCRDCRPVAKQLLVVHGVTLALLYQIAGSSPDIWDFINPVLWVRQEAFLVIDAFVEYYLGLLVDGNKIRRV